MRKLRFLIVALFLLVSCLLVGCGVEQELYDAVVTDLNTAEQELQSVKAELGRIQTELETAQTELETAKDEIAVKKIELESSQSKITTLTAEKDSLTAEKDSLLAEKESLQADYEKLTDENDAVKEELNNIKEVYPARHFSSKKELEEWLYENDVSDRPASTLAEALFEKALDIQEDALKDGYIISAYIDYYPEDEIFVIVLEAIAGGDIFMFNPETDDLINFSEATDLLKVGQ